MADSLKTSLFMGVSATALEEIEIGLQLGKANTSVRHVPFETRWVNMVRNPWIVLSWTKKWRLHK